MHEEKRNGKAMREKINRLAKGIIENEAPEITLIPEAFQDALPADGRYRLVLELEGNGGANVKGLCYSDNPRISVETKSFLGKYCRISFVADTSFLAAGTRMYGSLALLTNAGEYRLPYEFTVTESEAQKPAEKVRHLNAEPFSESYPAAKKTERTREEEAALLFFLSHLPEDEELFSELCALLIREQWTDAFAHGVYREAIERGLDLVKLYEYYVFSYPKDASEVMPKEVLLYFSYDSTLSHSMKSAVYENVLRYVDAESELYRSYEPKIRDFAMEALFARCMDDRLRLIYDRMIYPDMIDKKAAAVLPDLLKCHRILCSDPDMRTVNLSYPELSVKEHYPLKGGLAYIPIYFKDAVLSFTDAEGRERSDLSYTKEEMLKKPALLKRAFSLWEESPMLKLSALREILKKGVGEEREKLILCDALKTLPLRKAVREAVSMALFQYGGSLDWLSYVNSDEFSEAARKALLRSYLREELYAEAYLLLRHYGLHLADADELSRIAEGAWNGRARFGIPAEDDAFFLSLSKKVFDEGREGEASLQCLLRSYEGATEDMYAVMERGQNAGLPLYELPEKVLVAKLFSGDRTHLDEAFMTYLSHSVQKEIILRAYFTLRANDYFEKEDEGVSGTLFEALYSYLSTADDLSRLPDIYLIALTKYYSEKEVLLEDEKALCQKLADCLIASGLIFRYTKALKKKICIPREICDRYYIEYHGDRNTPPRMLVKILPEEEGYRPAEMLRVYQGVYVMSTVLFMGDSLHYLIYDGNGEEAVQEGVITVKKVHGKEENRYAKLNAMTKALWDKDLENLGEMTAEYVMRDEMSRKLFTVLDWE